MRLQDCDLRLASPDGLSGRNIREAIRRHRLAYRDVASATNRLTLISAIVPPDAVTVHTLHCLKGVVPFDDQVVLCCLLNSLVTNYLVRMWVTTHLGTSTVERLPVPRPPATSWHAGRLRDLGRGLLQAGGRQPAAYAETQGLAALLYGLSPAEFALVLESFPLIEAGVKEAAAGWHRRLVAESGWV